MVKRILIIAGVGIWLFIVAASVCFGVEFDADDDNVFDSQYKVNQNNFIDGSTIAEILDDDGSGSGLDADLLDGHNSDYFEPADATILKDADIGSTVLAPDGTAAALTNISSKPWVPGKSYTVDIDIVSSEGDFYTCTDSHTSSISGPVGDEPGVGDNWAAYWTQTLTEAASTKIITGNTEVTTTDTGTDGTINIIADGETVASATDAGFVHGPHAADDTIAVDDTFSQGPSFTATAGEELVPPCTVFIDPDDGKLYKTDADAGGDHNLWGAMGLFTGKVGDVGSTAAVNDEAFVMQVGFFYDTAWTFSVKDQICISETAGGLIACDDATVCAATGDLCQMVGLVTSTDRILFNFLQGFAIAE